MEVIADTEDGPVAAAAAEPVAAGPVVAGDDEAVATPTTGADCVGVRAVVTETAALGELTVPEPPWYIDLPNDICGAVEDNRGEEEETTLPADFCRMIVVVGVVVFVLLRLFTVASEVTGIRPTPPANVPPCPLAMASGTWISWMDIGWLPDVPELVVITPWLGRVCSSRVPVWVWPAREEVEEEAVEPGPVERIWRIGADAAKAEEVAVVGVEKGLV